MGWTSSAKGCPITTLIGHGPTSSSRPSDGAIYEVDLLVLTKQGFWLVECKAWGGRITGDTGSWTRIEDGKVRSEDNPVLLANRKAKALSSLLKAQSALAKVKVPWLDALVFLSADEVQCELTGAARNRVCLKDRPAEGDRPERKGIIAALLNRDCQGVDPDLRSTIDTPVAKALSRAMEQAGIRPSQRARRVGDYVLGELIADGVGLSGLACQARLLRRTFIAGSGSTPSPRRHRKRTDSG